MNRRLFLSLGVSAAVAGCTSSKENNEASEEGDQQPLEADNTEERNREPQEADVAWETDIPEPNAGPIAYDNRIYLPIQNFIVAYDGSTGEGLWEGEVFREAQTAPYITEDRVYVPSIQGGVYGFTHSGTLDWRVERDEFIQQTPVVTDEMVIAGGRTISAMSIDNEEILWNSSGGRNTSSAFTADSDAVYFRQRESGTGVSRHNLIRCVDSETGEELWSVDHELWGGGTLQIVGDDLLITSGNNLFALDVTNGVEKWRTSFENGSIESTVIDNPESNNPQLYIRERDSRGRRDTIHALQYGSRERKWSYERDFERLSTPVVAKESLFLVGSDNEITQLDRIDGLVSGRVQMDRNMTAPTVTSELVVVQTVRNEILGIRRDAF